MYYDHGDDGFDAPGALDGSGPANCSWAKTASTFSGVESPDSNLVSGVVRLVPRRSYEVELQYLELAPNASVGIFLRAVGTENGGISAAGAASRPADSIYGSYRHVVDTTSRCVFAADAIWAVEEFCVSHSTVHEQMLCVFLVQLPLSTPERIRLFCFVGCAASAPDGSSPRGYVRLEVVEHRLNSL